MNCPTCNSAATAEQQFCRSCGSNLTGVEPRRINPQLWGLSLAFGGILIAIAGRVFDVRVVLFLGVLISITGMFLTAAFPMLHSALKRRVTAPSQPESLPVAPTTKKLSPIGDFEYVPASVTEGTTDLLKEPILNRADPEK
jgi:hypothetical protein